MQLVPQVAAEVQHLSRSSIHTSAVCCRVQSGRYRITTKRNRALTYEMANPPHFIGHRKSWNSWNTCELGGQFIRDLYSSPLLF
ncbi:hypothetical protein M5D96_002658 [Drosophila gunungcola]|uniref:28S ribosomal protein S24, mitochondrial n=1 Tax=Drosophila gunungcola TaxID=103775 RepID=A0A9P9Z0G7_9MUSC|nr:hypothetical protein M5D96_002658 [Drosophila gunungcola]